MSKSSKRRCFVCFSVLSDGTRVGIVTKLQKGTMNVSEITKLVGLKQPTISHHLKILDKYGFVRKEKKGRETYYSFDHAYPCKECGLFSAPIKA